MNRRTLTHAVVGLVLVVLFVQFAWSFLHPKPSTPRPPAAPSASSAPVQPAEPAELAAFTELLTELTVASEENAGYDRDLFTHWTTQDGCTTRQLVLLAEATVGARADCTVTGGQWSSWYDGVSVTAARSIDIDHMVPLAEAFGSGAHAWSPERRKAYANDLGYPESLQAVTATSNRSKSDRDPSEWLPPAGTALCRYAQAWVAVKWRWDLTVDPAEKQALARDLRGCTSRLVPDPVRAR